MIKLRLVVSLIALSVSGRAQAAEFFVVTDTLKSQQDAQARAALVGGWVLDTDAYTALAPDLFAVVRGPYSTKQVADQRLKELKAIETYRTAYVKEVPLRDFGAVHPSWRPESVPQANRGRTRRTALSLGPARSRR